MSFTNTPYKKQGNWNRTGTGYIYMYICVSTYTHICIETLPILKEAIVVKLEHLLLDFCMEGDDSPLRAWAWVEDGAVGRENVCNPNLSWPSGACWGPPMASHSSMKEKNGWKVLQELHVASEQCRKGFPPSLPSIWGIAFNAISTEQKCNSLLLEENKKKPKQNHHLDLCHPPLIPRNAAVQYLHGIGMGIHSLLAKLKDTTWLPERHFTLDQTRWVHTPRSLFQEHLGKISVGHLFRLCRGLRGRCWWVLDHPILSLGHGVALTLQRPGHHGELCPSLPSSGREKFPLKHTLLAWGNNKDLFAMRNAYFSIIPVICFRDKAFHGCLWSTPEFWQATAPQSPGLKLFLSTGAHPIQEY